VYSVSPSLKPEIAQAWTGRLAYYGTHRNDEHLRALFEEVTRYFGLHLENDLCRSDYWSRVPLERKAAILLFLVDKGVVARSVRHGRRVFEPLAHAESWAAGQASLRPHLAPVIELFGALRHELGRRVHSKKY
jgi:hypothetical protein